MKKSLSCILILAMLLSFCACAEKNTAADDAKTVPDTAKSLPQAEVLALYPDAKVLSLSENTASLEGTPLKEYDYVWAFDPSMTEPACSGDEPDASECYVAHDLIYYPRIDKNAFTKENYDGETEWVTHYSCEGQTDYLFGTLPVLGTELPENMMHSAEEAYANPVLHITQPGEYILEGSWKGQIYVDLGDKDDCFADESKKVTLILNGANVTCTAAPAVIFHSLYECDNGWEERTEATDQVDTSGAGARVVLVDGTENNFSGANVYRLLKAKYKNDSTKVQKKYYKTDAAFYSYVSMEIDGSTGILNVTSTTFEGLDTELHLTVNGGYVNIVSQDDGINVNEDHISVFAQNGGRITIFAGQGAEGDVVDSNGYIRINGGFIAGASPSGMDDMLDSEDGTYVAEGATVISNVAGIEGGGFGPGGFNPGQGGFDPGNPGQGDFNPGQGGFDPGQQGKPPEMPQAPGSGT